jgi:hypothetical protein
MAIDHVNSQELSAFAAEIGAEVPEGNLRHPLDGAAAISGNLT